MRQILRDRAVAVCDAKIALKGDSVGLSFYAFFKNKNDESGPVDGSGNMVDWKAMSWTILLRRFECETLIYLELAARPAFARGYAQPKDTGPIPML